MVRYFRVISALAVIAAVIWFAGLAEDKRVLTNEMIRLHVVADSDSAEDQALKLRVKDAVVDFLAEAMAAVENGQQAREKLESMMTEVEAVARGVLQEAGRQDSIRVTLAREEFGTREYDTFSLPAGIYESLRIVIGDGEGKNWWCVVFPGLCTPVTVKEFETEAAGAGFSDTLTDTVSKNAGYEIRFWFLDVWGKIENFFHRE